MTHCQPLPSIKALKRLATETGSFPITGRHLLLSAKRMQLDDELLSFLALLPPREVFRDRAELLERCRDVEALVRTSPESNFAPAYDHRYF